MKNIGSFSTTASPVFYEENYQVWTVKIQAYLEVCDLGEAVEKEYEVLPLLKNLTMTQIKTHKKRKTTKFKAKSYLFAAISATIFNRIIP